MNLTVGLADSGADITISGTAEDEITKAAAEVGAAGGGTVTLLPGTYDLESGAVIKNDNVTLLGAGIGKTVLKAEPDFQLLTFGAVTFQGANNFAVSGITVDATGIPALGGTASTNGVTALECGSGTINSCQVLLSQNWSYGIWARQSDNIKILNNHVDGGAQAKGQEGIEVFDSDNVTIAGNTVQNVGYSGIGLFFLPDPYWPGANQNHNIYVTDNDIDTALFGVRMIVIADRSIDGITVQRNTLNNAGADPIGDIGAGVMLENYRDSPDGPSATVGDPQHISNINETYNFINMSPNTSAGIDPAENVVRTGAGEAVFTNVNLTHNTVVDHVIDGSHSGDLYGGGGANLITFYEATGTVAIDLNVSTLIVNGVAGHASDFDHVVGSPYNDIIAGNGGANILDGGPGIDTVAYYSSIRGVDIDLAAGFANNGTVTDTLLSFENVVGSAYNDTIAGTAGPNVLDGRGGADVIYGNEGDDTLIDGVGVNGAAGSVLDGGAGSDTITLNGSQAYTSKYVTLLGGDGNDLIQAATQQGQYLGSVKIEGGSGDDAIQVGHIEGSTGGLGYIDGGAGNDIIDVLDTWNGIGIWGNSQFKILGGDGDDKFDFSGTQLNVLGTDKGAQLDGGGGFDTLAWNGRYNLTIGGHQNPDVGLYAGHPQELNVSNVEHIDVASTGVSGLDLIFTAADVTTITAGSDFIQSSLGLGLTGDGHTLFVDPGANSIDVSSWTFAGDATVAAHQYHLYASGGDVLGLLV